MKVLINLKANQHILLLETEHRQYCNDVDRLKEEAGRKELQLKEFKLTATTVINIS